mmetsp:Transcript_34544/g.87341  ORF Transcript_34544/g.87341 Transcript_34544/m.87341 type:complete len:205 (+) Transcript_34544:370-984(+)
MRLAAHVSRPTASRQGKQPKHLSSVPQQPPCPMAASQRPPRPRPCLRSAPALARLHHDGVAAWPHANPLDVHAHQVLDALHVVARSLRQVVPLADLADVRLPAGQRLVLDLHALQRLQVGGHRVEHRALLGAVARAHLDLRQLVQHVQLGQVDVGQAIDAAHVAQRGDVHPADTARAARGSAVLVALLAQLLGQGAKDLSGVGP